MIKARQQQPPALLYETSDLGRNRKQCCCSLEEIVRVGYSFRAI